MNDPLPWGWHEAHVAPVLPNVGEHDDVALTMPEHDSMRDIAAHWEDEVPCNARMAGCPNAARWVWRCQCGHPFLGCDAHRQSADLIMATQRQRCGRCNTPIPSPIPWLPL